MLSGRNEQKQRKQFEGMERKGKERKGKERIRVVVESGW